MTKQIDLIVSKKPNDAQLKKLKEYFKEMPVEEIFGRFKICKK